MLVLKIVHFLSLRFKFNLAACVFICSVWQPYPSPNSVRVRGRIIILLPPSRDSTGMKLRSGVFRNAATPSGFPNLGCFGVQQACSHTHFLIHGYSHSVIHRHVCYFAELFWKICLKPKVPSLCNGLGECSFANRWCNFRKHSCRQSSPEGGMEAGSRHLAMGGCELAVEGGRRLRRS